VKYNELGDYKLVKDSAAWRLDRQIDRQTDASGATLRKQPEPAYRLSIIISFVSLVGGLHT